MSNKNYNVYFEIYGKKMKAKVLAENEIQAKQKVKDKVIFYKAEIDKNDDYNKSIDMMDELLTNLTKK